jgi:hypothetical protein
MGVVCGFICLGLAASTPGELPTPVVYQVLAERTLIGVAIGISCVTLGHWAIHGLVLGAIFSVPLACSGLMAPDSPEFSKTAMFVLTIVLGMIYGLLIELVTSVVFKAKNPGVLPREEGE